ncbi:hypothetical protein Q5M85_14030 [Paraclostridium bifermentans]|nr:hypothetical protein [Paraclostridium bifermentans]
MLKYHGSKWLRYIAPLIGGIIVVCIAFLTIGLYIGFYKSSSLSI